MGIDGGGIVGATGGGGGVGSAVCMKRRKGRGAAGEIKRHFDRGRRRTTRSLETRLDRALNPQDAPRTYEEIPTLPPTSSIMGE